MASYGKSLGTLTLATSLATPSFFYASLTIGRMLAPALLQITDEIRLVQTGLLLACAGMAGLIFSHALPGVAASACAAGLGLSYVYPITISLVSREFDSPRIGSLMFVLSNIGGGLFPWIVGVSSTRFGTLKAGLLRAAAGMRAYVRPLSAKLDSLQIRPLTILPASRVILSTRYSGNRGFGSRIIAHSPGPGVNTNRLTNRIRSMRLLAIAASAESTQAIQRRMLFV